MDQEEEEEVEWKQPTKQRSPSAVPPKCMHSPAASSAERCSAEWG